jgi:hypothetical protein
MVAEVIHGAKLGRDDRLHATRRLGAPSRADGVPPHPPRLCRRRAAAFVRIWRAQRVRTGRRRTGRRGGWPERTHRPLAEAVACLLSSSLDLEPVRAERRQIDMPGPAVEDELGQRLAFSREPPRELLAVRIADGLVSTRVDRGRCDILTAHYRHRSGLWAIYGATHMSGHYFCRMITLSIELVAEEGLEPPTRGL